MTMGSKKHIENHVNYAYSNTNYKQGYKLIQKKILEDRQLFRALSSHSVPLWPWKNWYCRIRSRSETNHRNEDGQSAASELIVSCGEYANSSGPRYINRPVEIGMPKWGTCQTSEPTEVFSHESIEWMIFVSRTALKWENWNWKLCRLEKLKSWLESFSYHWPGETYKYWIQACPLLGEKKFVKLDHL